MDGPIRYSDGDKNSRNIADWKISWWNVRRPLRIYRTDISKRSRREIIASKIDVRFQSLQGNRNRHRL